MALPANISTGTVSGVFLRAKPDGVDVDRAPDGEGIRGLKVTFTPSISPALVKDLSATPPVTILIDPVSCTTDDNGVLCGPDGQPGVKLVASGDTDLDPTGWTWTVEIKQSSTFPRVSFSFVVGVDSVIDLSTVLPVPAGLGADLVLWQQAVTDTLAAKVAAQTAQAAAETAAASVPTTAQLNATIDGKVSASESGEAARLGAIFPVKSQATSTPVSNRVGFAGDSITAASGATANNGFIHHVRDIAGTRHVDQVIRTYATGGYTAEQVLATHIPNACAGDAGLIHVAVGTNNAGGTQTATSFGVTITEIHRQIIAAGKKMSISLIPPRGSGATAVWRTDRAAYNEWISRWAQLAGVPIADTSTLVDPATGHLAASCDSGDGTHPNDLGHARIAEAVAVAVLTALGKSFRRQVKSPDVNLAAYGTIGAVGAGLPAGWSELSGGTGTAPTYSVVADTTATLVEGNWLQMDFDATASGGTRRMRTGHGTLNTEFVANDQLEFSWMLAVEDVSGLAAAIYAGTANVRVVNVNNSGGAQVVCRPAFVSMNFGGRGGYRFVQVSTTFPGFAVEVTLPTGVRAKVRVGEVLVRNLTKLGITAPIV